MGSDLVCTSHLRRLLFALLLVGSLGGCVDQDTVFTRGRIQATCNAAIPVCDGRAACVIGNDDYVEGTFPGGQKTIVRTETADNRLVVRFLLDEMVSPGTEMLVRAHQPGCNAFEQQHPTDVDLFERAGDDRILQFTLDLPGQGDHLLEVFSDMGADYRMTTTVEKSGS
jgi:hypothetical protein